MSGIRRFGRRFGLNLQPAVPSLFDIFGSSRVTFQVGSLQDDWRAIGEDFAAVGRDLAKVMGCEPSPSAPASREC